MKRFTKVLAIAVLGLLLTAVLGGFALTHLIDPNDYKAQIRQMVRDKANLELSLDGPIGWSLFPWLGLELTDTTLASADTPSQTFAHLRSMRVAVRLLPLLHRELQMSAISLNEPTLTLKVNAQGVANWQGVGRKASAASSASSTASTIEPTTSSTQDAPRPFSFDIESFTVRGLKLLYQNEQKHQKVSLEGIDLTTGAIAQEREFPIELSGYFSSEQPLLRAKAKLQAQARVDLAQGRYQLSNSHIQGELSGAPLSGKTLSFDAQGQWLLDWSAHSLSLNSAKFSLNKVRGLGEAKIYDLAGVPKFEGELSLASFNLRALLEELGNPLPKLRDANALTQVQLASRFSGQPNSLTLRDLTLAFDDSHLSGEITLSDLAKRAGLLKLSADRLELNRYLPESENTPEPATARAQQVKAQLASAGQSGTTALPEAPTHNAWNDQPLVPLATLRSLDLALELNLKQLRLSSLDFDNFNLVARSQQGLLELKQLHAGLRGGEVKFDGQLDARGPQTQWVLSSQIAGLPLAPLLKALDKPVSIEGDLDLTGQLRSQGNSEQALIEALDGTLKFNLLNGRLPDANIEQQLCQGIALLNRQPLTSKNASASTPFEKLAAILTISHGLAHNPDLSAQLPGLLLSGQGDLDLRNLGLNYRAKLRLDGQAPASRDPACQPNPKLAAIDWPLLCRGPLELGAKACRLDQDELRKIATQLAGDKLSEKIEEKLGNKVSPELKDALKGLFKR